MRTLFPWNCYRQDTHKARLFKVKYLGTSLEAVGLLDPLSGRIRRENNYLCCTQSEDMHTNLTYQSITDAEIPDYVRFLNYSFTPTQPVQLVDSETELPKPSQVSDKRGLFEGDDLRAICGHFWFETLIRGTSHSVGGLAEVASPPENRHKGYVGRLIAASLDEYESNNCPFSILWPFEYPFYRKYGWAYASKHARVTIPSEELGSLIAAQSESAPELEFVPLDEDDWEILDAIYRICNTQPLSMRRTEAWWKKRVLADWGQSPKVYGVISEGTIEGYIIYKFETTEAGTRLDIDELGYRDGSTLRALLRFCYYHDAQISSVRIHGPIEEAFSIQSLVEKPETIDIEIRPGPMVRIVSVREVLESLNYPTDASVVISIEDPIVEANTGRIRLEVQDGKGYCTETTDSPDVFTDIATLAQLIVGHQSAQSLNEGGVLTGDVTTCSQLFPRPANEPYLREWF